jgi:DNA-binding beta-propeller fold protein YncE
MAETIDETRWDAVLVSAPPPEPASKDQKAKLWIALAALALIAIVLTTFLASRPKPIPILGASSRSLAISSNGKLLLAGTMDGGLHLVSLATGKQIARAELPGAIAAVSFGPDDMVLALAQNETRLHIFSSDLRQHWERETAPQPHDVLWSAALDSAIVLSGGPDDIHARLEIFPAHPLSIANSTSQLFDLKTWSRPRHLAITGDGSRLGISFDRAARWANVIIYDVRERRAAATRLVPGSPEGIAMAANGDYLWVASPDDESITEIGPSEVSRIELPKSASTSPPRMLVVNSATRRAYTTGSLTFPEIAVEQDKIFRIPFRTLELPERSTGIVLSPDGATAYVTFEKINQIGILDLAAMKWRQAIELK